MNYLVDANGGIIGGILTSNLDAAKSAYDYEDDAEIKTAGLLEDAQIMSYLDSLNSWGDGDEVEDLMREMTRRYDLDFDEFDDYNDLYDAITERMASVPVEMYRSYGVLGHEKRPVYSMAKGEISDKVTVLIPRKYEPYQTVTGDYCLTLSGKRCLLSEILHTDKNDDPFIMWYDGHSEHHVVLKTN